MQLDVPQEGLPPRITESRSDSRPVAERVWNPVVSVMPRSPRGSDGPLTALDFEPADILPPSLATRSGKPEWRSGTFRMI